MAYFNRYILFKCLLIIFVLTATAGAADLIVDNSVTSPSDGIIWATDSDKNPKDATVVMSVKNLVASPTTVTDLILAIDCSASLGPNPNYPKIGSDPERQRVVAAKQLVASLRPNDRLGVVLWNESVIGIPLDLTSNFTEVETYLNDSGSSGETSLWNALNASSMLLRDARPNSKKVIVLFSDGNDTIRPATDFKGLASKIKQSGVDIYAVGLGDAKITDLQAIASPDRYYHVSDNMAIPKIFQTIGSEIMRSISDVQVNYALPVGVEIFDSSKKVNLISRADGQSILVWDIGSMLPEEEKAITFKVRSDSMGIYTLAQPDKSAVTFIKTETNSAGTPQAIQPVQIQVKENADLSYSGIGKGGTIYRPFDDAHPEYGLTVTKSIERPQEGGCQDVVINFRTPTMPCNRTVVIALDTSGSILQSGLDQPIMDEISRSIKPYLNDAKFKMARVDWDGGEKTAMNQMPNGDLVSLNKFSSGIDYSSAFRSGIAINEIFNSTSTPIASNEFESTVYSVGLNESIRRLITAMHIPDAFGNETNSFSILFITAKSEFLPGVNDDFVNLTHYATQNHIQINSIGIDLDDSSTKEEQNALSNMSIPTGGRTVLIRDINDNKNPHALSDSITSFLNDACGNGLKKPVANNVTVTESIYPYLKVIGTSPTSTAITNSDNTTTLVWSLGNMTQGESRSIRIRTTLDLSKLPIEVNNKRTKVDFSPSASTSESIVEFTTNLAEPADRYKRMNMPEGELSIFCGQPCENCPNQPVVQTLSANGTTQPAGEKPISQSNQAPGFEVSLAVLGIGVSIYLAKRT